MIEHVFNRMKHYRKPPPATTGSTRPPLANLRLILIAIHLKVFIISYNFCHPKNQNHVKVGIKIMSKSETKTCQTGKRNYVIVGSKNR